MKKVIVGLTGLSGSGKSEISNWMEKQNGYSVIKLGQYLREQIMREEVKHNEIKQVAERYSDKSIAMLLENKIIEQFSMGNIVVIDSLRTVTDYSYLNGIADKFFLVTILANKEDRKERLLNRKRKGDCKTKEELVEHDYWEMDFGLKNLFVMSDYFIVNNGSIQDMVKSFGYILKKEKLNNNK